MSDIRVPPIDEVASTANDEERREIAQELRHYAVYGEGATLSEWWARLQSIATGEDDFPNPRSLFMRLAGLIDGSACFRRLLGGHRGQRQTCALAAARHGEDAPRRRMGR